ncbi:uncharacterized protein [Prorops nasuta]|uniref:uncharacterized protein n=1 Tax=Prorops nasuta TaxID=863751 RepID=UPI0034CE092A
MNFEIPVDKNLVESLPFEEESTSYQKFLLVCSEIFGATKPEEKECLFKIFQFFDVDNDGVLNSQEWSRLDESWLQPTLNPKNALIIVDVQNDFIDGSLSLRDCPAGQDSKDVINPINRLIRKGKWDKIIYTLDWHPENHISFYENLHSWEIHPDSKFSKEVAKPFGKILFKQESQEIRIWPKHCIKDTWGAQLHKDLLVLPGSEKVLKGENAGQEAYSAFLDTGNNKATNINDILIKSKVTNVYICGVAYDVCVKETSLDALKFGYRVAVIDDCCRGTNVPDIQIAKNLITENSGLIADSEEILSIVNGNKFNFTMAYQGFKSLVSKISS